MCAVPILLLFFLGVLASTRVPNPFLTKTTLSAQIVAVLKNDAFKTCHAKASRSRPTCRPAPKLHKLFCQNESLDGSRHDYANEA